MNICSRLRITVALVLSLVCSLSIASVPTVGTSVLASESAAIAEVGWGNARYHAVSVIADTAFDKTGSLTQTGFGTSFIQCSITGDSGGSPDYNTGSLAQVEFGTSFVQFSTMGDSENSLNLLSTTPFLLLSNLGESPPTGVD